MPLLNHKEALLILSGIASEATMKNKNFLDPQQYIQIFEAYQDKCLKNRDIQTLSYSQIATVVWAYSIVKSSPEQKNLEFWNAVLDHVENLIAYQAGNEQSLYHTIIIGKGLSHIDPEMSRCIQFWSHFKSFFSDTQVLQANFARLSWNELVSILFTLS